MFFMAKHGPATSGSRTPVSPNSWDPNLLQQGTSDSALMLTTCALQMLVLLLLLLLLLL